MEGASAPFICTIGNNMLVQVKFNDNNSLTAKEIIAANKVLFGVNAEVHVQPQNNSPEAYIYFALQNMITEEQMELLFDSPHVYQKKIEELKNKTHKEIDLILDKVLEDNKQRVE